MIGFLMSLTWLWGWIVFFILALVCSLLKSILLVIYMKLWFSKIDHRCLTEMEHKQYDRVKGTLDTITSVIVFALFFVIMFHSCKAIW